MHFLEKYNASQAKNCVYIMGLTLLDGTLTTSRLHPDTSPVLIPKLDAPECSATDGDEESGGPHAGYDKADGEECQARARDDKGLGGLNGSGGCGGGVGVDVCGTGCGLCEDAVHERCVA
jgi:hypothetical protein